MGIDILIYLGFGVLMAVLFAIVYFKDIESNKKFERFGRTIEDLNRQNHQLKQALLHKSDEKTTLTDDIKSNFKGYIQQEMASQTSPLLHSLKEIEGIIEEFKVEQEKRIIKLEERTKGLGFAQGASASNDKQVIQAFRAGKNPQTIAKDLRIGVGEVEFILKMHNLL